MSVGDSAHCRLCIGVALLVALLATNGPMYAEAPELPASLIEDLGLIRQSDAKSRVSGCQGLLNACNQGIDLTTVTSGTPVVESLIGMLSDHTPLSDLLVAPTAKLPATATPASAAAGIIELIGEPGVAAVPALTKMMQENHFPFEVENAARALIVLDPKNALKPIQIALTKYGKESRTRAVLLSAELPYIDHPKQKLGALATLVGSKDDEISAAAAVGLTHAGTEAVDFAPQVIARLKTHWKNNDKPPTAKPGSIKKARSGSGPLGEELSRALGAMGGDKARKVILEMGRSESWQQQSAAAAGLGRLGDAESLALMVKLLKESEHPVVESAVLHAIKDMGGKGLGALLDLREFRKSAKPLVAPLVDETLTALVASTEGPDSTIAMERFEYSQKHMGCEFRVVLYCWDEKVAVAASDAAFAKIHQLDEMMSDYNPESELMQLCERARTNKGRSVSPDLLAIVKTSQEISRDSGGAFDISVGPFVKLWRVARKSHKKPDDAALKEAKSHVGWKKVRFNEADVMITLDPDMQLDLGGIAKGYAGDRALQVLRSFGVRHAMVDAAGNIVAAKAPPGKPGWQIQVESLRTKDSDPAAEEQKESLSINLVNASVSTSGDAYRFVEVDGVRYSHIVDPRTGLGLTLPSQVTVIAPTGAIADGLSTAANVLGPENGAKLMEKYPGACLHYSQRGRNGKVEITQTADWEKWLAP